MATHNIYGIPIDVDNVFFDSEDGTISSWDVSFRGVRITDLMAACDFFSQGVVDELERQVIQHAKDEGQIAREWAAECQAEMVL